jgi:hypothetical protein
MEEDNGMSGPVRKVLALVYRFDFQKVRRHLVLVPVTHAVVLFEESVLVTDPSLWTRRLANHESILCIET